ncbi:TonB-dependent receptor plug domain-containing protein [uncultured Alistipes sp.]|uniref:TonB-dependent receptor plug domain-containing protein n=1 Tax=uncultured Alistipes sp. TaxID=538949 RepID=UPI0025DBDB82|nr:TonB-dependent receptor plug domain-containing protein [uncultured Alistipes sp.]
MNNIQAKQVFCFKRWKRTGWAVFASFRRFTMGVLPVTMSILLLATLSASAQTADSVAVLKTLRIDEVGITGSQSAPTRNVQSQTPLFDRKAQAAAPFETLESALRLVPSVDIRQRGGKGIQTDIFIRGGSFDQTMVLLNGIDFTDARTGHQSHSLPVDLDCISAVDLLDGVPGVGAYAGAVNIRTAPLRPTYLRFEGSGGQYGYAYGNLSGAVTTGRFSLLAAGSYRRSDGYRHNTDFDNSNAFVRATYQTQRLGFFDFQAGWQNRGFGSNGFYAGYNPDQWEGTSTTLASMRWLKDAGRFSLGASASYRKNYDRYDWTRGTVMNRHNTDNVGAKLWTDCNWRGGVTSLGGDYAFNHIYSTNLGEKLSQRHGHYTHAKARHTGNIWLRHAKQWDRFDIAASAGVSVTPYGSSALWNISGGYTPVAGLRLGAGAFQSMRLPTFTDLYYSSPAQINNLDLIPEKAVAYLISADYIKGCFSSSLRTYYRAGRDIIDWVWREDMDGKWHSEQTSSLDTFGVELSGGYTSPEGFLRRVNLSYGYITTDRNTDVVAMSAMDFMKHKAALAVEVHFLRRMSLTLTASVYDRNGSYTHYPVTGDSSVSEIRDYEPYFLLDGRLQWEKGICRVYVDATNITDSRYTDLGGIRLPGVWFTGGVTLTIGR